MSSCSSLSLKIPRTPSAASLAPIKAPAAPWQPQSAGTKTSSSLSCSTWPAPPSQVRWTHAHVSRGGGAASPGQHADSATSCHSRHERRRRRRSRSRSGQVPAEGDASVQEQSSQSWTEGVRGVGGGLEVKRSSGVSKERVCVCVCVSCAAWTTSQRWTRWEVSVHQEPVVGGPVGDVLDDAVSPVPQTLPWSVPGRPSGTWS